MKRNFKCGWKMICLREAQAVELRAGCWFKDKIILIQKGLPSVRGQ
jgi:hypothetical protein